MDNIVYVITAKCFPLMGGVISTWLFFGAEVPLIVSLDKAVQFCDAEDSSEFLCGSRLSSEVVWALRDTFVFPDSRACLPSSLGMAVQR